MSTWAIVVAAGSGERFGERKQFQRLGYGRVVDWALRAAREHCDEVVLVLPADAVGDDDSQASVVVAGGATRSQSVRNGLLEVPADAEVVVVHDAARPVPAPEVWRRVLDAVAEGADAAIPVVPVTDTLREVAGGTVDRSRFVTVQTPQAFRASALRDAHRDAPEGTDDASLVEAIGGSVVAVEGDPSNIKITNPVDLQVAELLCL